MGVLTTHDRHDYETIATVSAKYEDYYLKYEYREYERYERFLVFRNRKCRRQVRLRAYNRDPSSKVHDPLRGFVSPTPIVEQKSTWDKGHGPSHSLDYQVRAVTDLVLSKLDTRSTDTRRFEDAIPDRVDVQTEGE